MTTAAERDAELRAAPINQRETPDVDPLAEAIAAAILADTPPAWFPANVSARLQDRHAAIARKLGTTHSQHTNDQEQS